MGEFDIPFDFCCPSCGVHIQGKRPIVDKHFLKVNNAAQIEDGKRDAPCNPTYFRDKFKEAVGTVEGVRVLTPHCCRHTYVSQMQALGVDLSTIQSFVGHADIDMTQHCLQVQDSVQQDAIKKFSAAFPVADAQVYVAQPVVLF